MALVALLVSACEPPPPAGPRPDGGFVELDENTDPRFVHYDRPGPIGWLRVAGTSVYLDGRVVERDLRLPNNAHVRTGPASGVRAELLPGTGPSCRIAAQDFRQGNLYGVSGSCLHEIASQQGAARAERTRTAYHASVRGERTVLTVIAGEMRAWSHRDPSRSVVVGPLQEVVLHPGAVVGPRPVSEDQVNERMDWRAAFDWGGKRSASAACERYARTAVEQNDENLKRSCGYRGVRWQSDYEVHYRWCLAVNDPRLAERESAIRAQALERCGQAGDRSEPAEDLLRYILKGIFVGTHRTRQPPEPDRGSTTGADSDTPPGGGTPPAGGDSAGTTPAAGGTTVDLRRLRELRRVEPVPEPTPGTSDLR